MICPAELRQAQRRGAEHLKRAHLPLTHQAQRGQRHRQLLNQQGQHGGRGVGAALTRECLRRAQQAGATAVTLHTTDMMRVAQGMYVRMGFERAPEIDFQPAPGITIKGYRFEFDKMS